MGFKLSKFFNLPYKLFTLEDVIANVEIWRRENAVGVLSVIAQIFGVPISNTKKCLQGLTADSTSLLTLRLFIKFRSLYNLHLSPADAM